MKATFSFVPTPSAEATSTGSAMPGNAPSNIPPNVPISESVRALNVPRASRLIFSTAAFAASIDTPASEYVIDLPISFQSLKLF
jgi:hypothetical protein